MGQKVNPKAFRIGIGIPWSSKWFADNKSYKNLLIEDVKLRRILLQRLSSAGIAQVNIERSIHKIKIILAVSRPGIVIGRGGKSLEALKKFLEDFMGKNKKVKKNKTKIELVVEPVKEPNLNAYLVARNIADQLVKRLPHKRVCNQTIERVMHANAKGVKILLSGRIRGAEIARKEKFQDGVMPLSTIRENIDFAHVPALTKSGYIGVKVWICRK